MLRDEIARYTELSGNDGEHTPIGFIGAFLDGYETGLKDGSKREWTPVSSGKLPKEPYACWVTVWDTDILTQEEFENVLPYPVGYDGETWNDGDGNICPYEVIAWMPAPKPYKAESESI